MKKKIIVLLGVMALVLLISGCINTFIEQEGKNETEYNVPAEQPEQEQPEFNITEYECSVDLSCNENQSCVEHECEDLECGECQYISNHSCVNYECCDDEDCADEMKCISNVCQEEYNLNYECGNDVCENMTVTSYRGKDTLFTINGAEFPVKLVSCGDQVHLFIGETYEILSLRNSHKLEDINLVIKNCESDSANITLGENENSCPQDCGSLNVCGNGICENQTMTIYQGETISVIGNNGDEHTIYLEGVGVYNSSVENYGVIKIESLGISEKILIARNENYNLSGINIYVNHLQPPPRGLFKEWVILTFGENYINCFKDCN